MRIWSEQLIPKLCQKHLCAMWREGLGAYKIITENKKGYRNHPAVKEFENSLAYLYDRLEKVRIEMIIRGYHPKEMLNTEHDYPELKVMTGLKKPKEWQTLDQQIAILKSKGCKCKV